MYKTVFHNKKHGTFYWETGLPFTKGNFTLNGYTIIIGKVKFRLGTIFEKTIKYKDRNMFVMHDDIYHCHSCFIKLDEFVRCDTCGMKLCKYTCFSQLHENNCVNGESMFQHLPFLELMTSYLCEKDVLSFFLVSKKVPKIPCMQRRKSASQIIYECDVSFVEYMNEYNLLKNLNISYEFIIAPYEDKSISVESYMKTIKTLYPYYKNDTNFINFFRSEWELHYFEDGLRYLENL